MLLYIATILGNFIDTIIIRDWDILLGRKLFGS